MTVCSYIKHKKHEGMSQTQVVAGVNLPNSKSRESSDSAQHNEGGPRKPGRHQDEKCNKHRSSSVRPMSAISVSEVFFHHVIFCQSITKFLIVNPSGCSGSFLFSNICLCLQLCDMQGAECGAAAAFQIASFLIFDVFFDFVLCDVGHFIITQSHSIDVSCWSAFRFLLCLALFSDISSAVIV